MKRRGLTLVEMLLASALSFVLLVAVLATLKAGQSYFHSALDAVALSDYQYRVPREIVQKLMASTAEQVTPGSSSFSFATAYDRQNQFQVSAEGLPEWQGLSRYRLERDCIQRTEPWEKTPKTLARNITSLSLKSVANSYLLTLNIDYHGYTRDFRGEVSMWATPVN